MGRAVTPLVGVFSRCVALGRDPLSTEGSRLFGGRFNAPGSPALYLAGTPTLAVAEQLQFAGLLGLPVSHSPRLLVAVEVQLSTVLDLTDPAVRGSLALDAEALRGEWQSGGTRPDPLQRHADRSGLGQGGEHRGDESPVESLTQALGRRIREEGLEGILYASRVEPAGRNLVVFPENLRATSRIRLVEQREHSLG